MICCLHLASMWRKQFPPKLWYLSSRLHGVTSQNNVDVIITSVTVKPEVSYVCKKRMSHGSINWDVSVIQLLCFWTLSIVLFSFKTQVNIYSVGPNRYSLYHRTSSIDWAQSSRCYLKTETEFSPEGRWIMFKNTIVVLIYHRHKIRSYLHFSFVST
jgi:hypothetical protein